MEKLLIEWGKLDRTEAIENAVKDKATKILKFHPEATKLVVSFKIINPISSAGPARQQVSMELRRPNHQDVRASKEGEDVYGLILETEKAILAQKR